MNKQQSIFKKENKSAWEAIKSNLFQKVNEQIGIANKDFQVTIESYKENRSCQQLKGYWVLVKAIQDWMIEQGNLYLGHGRDTFNVKDIGQLSDWVKIESGFFTQERITVKMFEYSNFYTTGSNKDFFNRDYPEVTKKAKSIANNSDCTREDMKKIIDWILAFAAEFGIVDCYIQDMELDKLLKFYDRN